MPALAPSSHSVVDVRGGHQSTYFGQVGRGEVLRGGDEDVVEGAVDALVALGSDASVLTDLGGKGGGIDLRSKEDVEGLFRWGGGGGSGGDGGGGEEETEEEVQHCCETKTSRWCGEGEV